MNALLLAALAVAAPATKFTDVATVTAAFVPAAAKPGQVVTLRLTISPKPGFWTYPADPPEGQLARNLFRLPPAGDVAFGPVTDPANPKSKPAAGGGIDLYYPGPATWDLPMVVSPKAKPGKLRVALGEGTKLQVCNDGGCYYSDKAGRPAAELEVLAGPAEAVTPEWQARLDAVAAPVAPSPAPAAAGTSSTGLIRKSPQSTAEYAAALANLQANLDKSAAAGGAAGSNATGLLAFLATAAVWGWISLLTPCVFPMIPITVSLFLKHGKQSAGKSLQLAAVYCLTIVVVLGISAVALLGVFRKLSVDPIMNAFLGVLFVAFALSLFGLYDLTLPNGLLRFAEKRRAAGGLFGTVFGAIAFSIVSFTCVAPFLGGFAGMASSGQFAYWELVLGGIAFAAAFASPFFVLALFPGWLKKLPRSGGWLDTVKVVMGFIEIAAALKFFRTAELRILAEPVFFTYDIVLAGWVAVSAACGLYLLNAFRLPHDEEKGHIGAGRLVAAMLFLGLGVYLLPGLFKHADGKPQRPTGGVFAWVDSFLLPDHGAELPWSADLPGSLDAARRDGQLVFVDFTGVTCTNCKLNEQNVFPRPEVNELLRNYRLVQLYTDEVPAGLYASPPGQGVRDREADANGAFQVGAFGTVQLPLYAILAPSPTGARVVAVYDEGKINDVAAFAKFLRTPLSK